MSISDHWLGTYLQQCFVACRVFSSFLVYRWHILSDVFASAAAVVPRSRLLQLLDSLSILEAGHMLIKTTIYRLKFDNLGKSMIKFIGSHLFMLNLKCLSWSWHSMFISRLINLAMMSHSQLCNLNISNTDCERLSCELCKPLPPI